MEKNLPIVAADHEEQQAQEEKDMEREEHRLEYEAQKCNSTN